MEDRQKFLIGIGVACGVLVVLLIVYFVSESFKVTSLVFSVVNVFVIVLCAILLIRDRQQARKKGLPIEDEMSKKITYKAGYYSWVVSMCSIIGIMLMNIAVEETSSYHIDIDRTLPFLVIVPGMAFVFLQLNFKTRGIEE